MGVLGIKHQGLGRKQVKQREKTEKILKVFLKENQPVYFNKILRESEISDPYALKKAIQRCLEKKKIRIVLNSNGPKNRKYYAMKSYQSGITPYELEQFEKIPRKKHFVVKDRSKLKKLTTSVVTEIIQKIERSYWKGKHRHRVSIQELKHIIIFSETVLTKNHACKLYHIKPETLNQNIKRNPELQLLQKKIIEKIVKAEKNNLRIIPQIRDGKLMIATVTNATAEKYGY